MNDRDLKPLKYNLLLLCHSSKFDYKCFKKLIIIELVVQPIKPLFNII